MHKLNRPIVVSKITLVSDLSYTQWQGVTADNRKIYVRLRDGYISILLGDIGDESNLAKLNVQYLFNGEYNGLLSYCGLKQIGEDTGIIFPDCVGERRQQCNQ